MEKVFQGLAAILAGVAAYLLWSGNTDWGFVTAVGGAVSFFLSIRVGVKRRLDERERELDAAYEAEKAAAAAEASSTPNEEVQL